MGYGLFDLLGCKYGNMKNGIRGLVIVIRILDIMYVEFEILKEESRNKFRFLSIVVLLIIVDII